MINPPKNHDKAYFGRMEDFMSMPKCLGFIILVFQKAWIEIEIEIERGRGRWLHMHNNAKSFISY